MTTGTLNSFIQRLRRSALPLDLAARTDGELVADYAARRDQAAFEALVRRHGAMVWGVCRRILGNEADAEDAFQATFLVLVRKAGAIRAQALVGNWLYGVAHNTALKARAMNRRRRAKERAAALTEATLSWGQAGEEVWRQTQTLLDEAMSRLADKHRAAIVLCDLEGKTIKEAARQLGCPQGTVATNLARGRALLAQRLTRHGLTLSAGALTAILSEGAASAGAPPAPIHSTIQAAAGGTVSAKVAALTQGVLAAMFLSKLKSAALFALALLSVAVGLWVLPMMAAQPPGPSGKDKVPPPKGKQADQPVLGEHGKPGEIAVIVKAQLYEVDEAFYQQVAKAKRLSREELEELERIFLGEAPKNKLPEGAAWPKFTEKQKLLLDLKEAKFELGKDGTLVALHQATKCLPSPEQLRRGDKTPQTIQQGVALLGQLHISADRRYVRARFTEKSVEIEGIDKVKALVDNEGNEALAEIAYLKESGQSQMRDIPDGGTYLVPLQYRPHASRDAGRWLVVKITPRIYIEEEERQIRGQPPK